ncbi:peptidyl-tRNA hydrolase PTH2-domain-containing protein [Mycena galopus ATCC 62051]|nr:peptidyl-tRNA hydrolase PTH2-domain-containing protein [Mycena galopus ATCC 62051]
MAALVATYFIAITASLSFGYYTGSRKPSVQLEVPQPRQPKANEEEDSDSESEQDGVSVLTTQDDCKLVLAVRTDLGMTTGKIAAQCSHATLACYKTLVSKLLGKWARTGYLKSVVRCSDEDALLLLQAQAQSVNLARVPSKMRSGRTQIAAGSTTVLGIAGPSILVDEVTEGLSAL